MKDSLKGRSTRQGVKINLYENDELIKQFGSRKECFEFFEGKISEYVIKCMLSKHSKCRKYPMYRLEYADNKDHHIIIKNEKIV